MLVISYIFAKYPPKKSTTYMGTEPSVHVIKTVGIANRHSIRLMWKISLLTWYSSDRRNITR